jgi:hypothetical protein
MGYWSEHPMGGDEPLDETYRMYRIMAKLTNVENINEILENDDEDGSSLTKLIYSIIEKPKLVFDVLISLQMRFVFPWAIYEKAIEIKNEEVKELLKEAIGDGGHNRRCYHHTDPGPATYSKTLYDNWDEICTGNIDSALEAKLDGKGLLTVIFESIANDEPKMVNCN